MGQRQFTLSEGHDKTSMLQEHGINLLDTIEELSDILVLDSALVGDGSG